MAKARIEARLGPCIERGAAEVPRYDLRYHKQGKDGSGKCDAYFTGKATDTMYGVLFEITPSQAQTLDGHEGPGYSRRTIEVITTTGPDQAYAYIARPNAIVQGLQPYDWYHAFVLDGATKANLPPNYLTHLRTIQTKPDPDPTRSARNRQILT